MEEDFLFENTFTVRQSDAADESDSNTESDTSGSTAETTESTGSTAETTESTGSAAETADSTGSTAGAAGTAPATGDMNQVWLWILMMAVSLTAVVIAERLRRRE